MTYLIAEISNHHAGSLDKAFELIRVAKESGADCVKSQAFIAEDMLKSGSMPLDFYQQCEMRYEDYLSMIEYGRQIGVPVFFTVLSSNLFPLYRKQIWRKIHANGYRQYSRPNLYRLDKPNTIISVAELRPNGNPIFVHARILYATQYLKGIEIKTYHELCAHFHTKVGVSHHGKDVSDLMELIKTRMVPIIEKHFYLGEDLSFENQIYRDCLHSANPQEFYQLAKEYKR